MSAGWMIQSHASAFLLIVLFVVLCPVLLSSTPQLSADDISAAKEPEQGREHVEETPEEPAQLDQLQVTGSHIKRAELGGPSPTLILDRAALDRSGAFTVADVLSELPYGGFGSINSRDSHSTALGSSAVSFRGLGPNATLVLVNGRRMAQAPFLFDGYLSFVDLGTIPLAAVDRIDILRGGASAIYGSDAIAGVINIILREDFSGLELSGRAGVADANGASEKSFSAVWGVQKNRFSGSIFASYSNRDKLFWRDRAISRTADQRALGGFDLRSVVANNFFNDGAYYFIEAYGSECDERPGDAAGIPDFELDPDFGACLYNTNSQVAEPAIERLGINGILTYSIRQDLQLHLEAGYLNSKIDGQIAPTAIGVNGPSDELITFPESNPHSLFFEDVWALHRMTELGPRINELKSDKYRALVVLEGGFSDWDWEVGLLYDKVSASDDGRAYLDTANIIAAMNGVDLDGNGSLEPDEYLNVFSPASQPNSLALLEFVSKNTVRKSESEMKSIDGQISGPIAELPTGDLMLAVGFESRRESLRQISDQLSPEQQISGIPNHVFFAVVGDVGYEPDPLNFNFLFPLDTSTAPTVIGSRDQVSVFGELRIPLLDTLELQTSLRYEYYDDFGSTINPGIAISYRPLDRLLLRGSWGQGFRAPALSELNLGQSLSWDVAWDPKRCPDPTFIGVSACVVRSFFTVNSGNPNLEAEESESVTAGFAVQLAEYLTVSVDYWQIDHENRIVFPGLDWILRNEDALGPDIVVRGEPDPFDIILGLDIPGYIDQVNNVLLNLANQEVRGYDADISYNHETDKAGTFGARLMWTHLSSHKSAFGSTDDPEQLAGTWGYPENRANLDMYWLRKNWQLGIYGRWIDGFADRGEDTRVPSQIKWDSQLTFSGFRNTALTLGIENLFDEDPPFSPGTSFFRGQQGFPDQYYSMRGRFFYLQASMSF